MKVFLESPNLLETIIAEGEKNSTAARALVGQLNESQLNWKPAPEKWSIAQCLDHLAVTSHGFDSYFTKALARGRTKWPVTSPPKYRPSFIGGWLIKQVEPVTGRNLPAPKVFRPSSSNIENALEKFLAQQETFLQFVRATEGTDFNKTRLRSPVTPLMRYSLADAFVVTVVHGQRHLAQARRVRDTPGFPN
ncbi:MAG TPA: DinB family protein [Pyrinomonadaceae bacterium]|nr:DinB family protein [Pyrinomonadaceae bacterium]